MSNYEHGEAATYLAKPALSASMTVTGVSLAGVSV